MSSESNSKQEIETLIISKLDSMTNTLVSIEHVLIDLKNEIKNVVSNREDSRESTMLVENKIKKPTCKPGQNERGKYKYPVEVLNNMNLTYEKILSEAELYPRRLNKKYTVAELRDSTHIGVFARQVLASEIKNILLRTYPNSKWAYISTYNYCSDFAWKCTAQDCNFRLKLRPKFNLPYLVFNSDHKVHDSHEN